MSIEKVKAYFNQFGMADKIQGVFPQVWDGGEDIGV